MEETGFLSPPPGDALDRDQGLPDIRCFFFWTEQIGFFRVCPVEKIREKTGRKHFGVFKEISRVPGPTTNGKTNSNTTRRQRPDGQIFPAFSVILLYYNNKFENGPVLFLDEKRNSGSDTLIFAREKSARDAPQSRRFSLNKSTIVPLKYERKTRKVVRKNT